MTKNLDNEGLRSIVNDYEFFFIDLWGVIHNGIQLYPGAINVLENLNKLNKRFVLMSNAPRPSKSVKKLINRVYGKMSCDIISNFNVGKRIINFVQTSAFS